MHEGKIKEVKSTAPVTVGRMTYIQLDLRDIGSGSFVPTRFRMSENVELGTYAVCRVCVCACVRVCVCVCVSCMCVRLAVTG